MQIESKMKGAVTVLKPGEPLTSANADEVLAALREVAEHSYGRVVLDASSIAYVDSRGLEVLVELAQEMASSGRVLKLCAVTDTLCEILCLTGLDDHFEQFDDTTSAARSFL